MASLASDQKWYQKLFDRWLKKRMPAQTSQTLTQRRIFILPTKFGFTFALLVVVLFILGTNYQNNLILLISFFLASFFITTMLQSYFNFAGITISAVEYNSGFANSRCYVDVLATADRDKHQILFMFDGQERVCSQLINHKKQLVSVPFWAKKRGVYQLPRVKVMSYYPLGLFITWTRLDLNWQLTVYPTPQKFSTQQLLSSISEGDGSADVKSDNPDDFHQLTSYQQGQPLSQVAWKQLARGQGWWSKNYQSGQASPEYLTLESVPAGNLEQKLSYLCYLMLEYEQAGTRFGLKLTHCDIAPGNSKAHVSQCLKQLAVA